MKIAVMGYGTIGSGVVEALMMNREHIAKKAGQEIDVKYVLDLRDFPGDPIQEKIVHDASVIAQDAEVAVVVETMGGTKPAYDFVKSMLLAGKSVVTSNKALVAAHGTELLRLAKERNVNFLFEASVGGGIPVIRPLNTSLPGDQIQEITGILNGTTNYILTKMNEEGATFDDALKDAQALGYAERDPSADVEGDDARRKIAILSSIAYGHEVDYLDIHTEGITGITDVDFLYAKRLGRAIKLFATSMRDGGRTFAMVAPVMIDASHPLYGVSDVYNAVLVRGNVSGTLMFYGSGAGKLPTAGAVVADVIDAVRSADRDVMAAWDGVKLSIADKDEMESRFFLRIGKNTRERKTEAMELFGAETVLELDDRDEFGLVTAPMTEAAFAKKLASVDSVLNTIRVRV